jgi:hypothetical protein
MKFPSACSFMTLKEWFDQLITLRYNISSVWKALVSNLEGREIQSSMRKCKCQPKELINPRYDAVCVFTALENEWLLLMDARC